MRDSNFGRMIWIGLVAVLSFTAIFAGQLTSGQADSKAKSAACDERKRAYAEAAIGSSRGEKARKQTSDAERQEQKDLPFQALIDANAACTAALVADEGLTIFYTILLRTLPSIFGVLALCVAGLRYDADRRDMLSGKQTYLDIVPNAMAGRGAWTIRNLSGGIQTIEAFDVVRYRSGDVSRHALANLARLNRCESIDPAQSIVLQSTLHAREVLVAVLVRDPDGSAVTCWARFGPDSLGHRKKHEEGRML
jgi:hypothetical protein